MCAIFGALHVSRPRTGVTAASRLRRRIPSAEESTLGRGLLCCPTARCWQRSQSVVQTVRSYCAGRGLGCSAGRTA